MASPLVGLLVKLDEDELRHYDGERFEVLHRSRGIAVSGAVHVALRDRRRADEDHGCAVQGGRRIPLLRAVGARVVQRTRRPRRHLGRSAGRLHHQLVEAPSVDAKFRVLFDALLRRMCRPLQLHPAVELALARFRLRADVTRVGAVAAESGLSRRRFIEVFARRGRLHTEALSTAAALQSRAEPRVWREPDRLVRGRVSARLRRSIALQPRVPRILGPDAVPISGASRSGARPRGARPKRTDSRELLFKRSAITCRHPWPHHTLRSLQR